jgi:hypothetical protein
MKQEYGKDGEKKCKYLNFNLYGSPSGPRCWNVALHNKFLEMGFDQSTTDPSLYKRGELHVCVFVDDCLCTFPTSDKCVADYKEFVECIRKSFALRDDDDGMTDANEFCGMCIEWAPWINNSRAYFKITAPKAVNSVLRAMNFDGGCRTADTPLPSKTQCKLTDCPQKGPAGDTDRDFMADKNYLGHLGTLSWVQRVCRPDLAHACGCLARVGHNPGKAHWRLLQQCVRYLHGTRDMGLVYERRSNASTTAMTLEGMTDSDFAPNYGNEYDNYRSTSGHLFSYNNTPVQWASRRQDLLAMAAHEAEIYAAVDAAKEAVHLHRLLQDIGERTTAAQVLMGDNKPSVTAQQNFTDCTQSKHIDRRAHYIRHLCHAKKLNYKHIPGTENTADAFTKALPGTTFKKFRNHMNIR